MEVLETFTCSKLADPMANEDAFRVGEWYCMVADGVTSKTDACFEGKSGGRIAVGCMIAALDDLDGEEDAHTAFVAIRDRLRAYVQVHDVPEDVQLQATVLIYNKKRRELWSVGDCPYILNGVYHKNEKKSDLLLSELRKMAIEGALLRGYTQQELLEKDIGREMILPFLKMQSLFIDARSDFGYSVVNPVTVPETILVTPVEEGSELILASDGYPLLKPTLAQSEEALAMLLRDDPLCYRLCPSTKGKSAGNVSFDDRTYLRIKT